MYSPNAAYEAGRRLGHRHHDASISENDLVELISRQILPQVRPRSGQLAREAENMFFFAAAFTGLTAISVALFVAISIFGSEPWMPEILLRLPAPPINWAPVVLAPLTLLLWIGYWRANAQAQGQRRRLRQRLSSAAYRGAVETLTARRNREEKHESSRVRKDASPKTVAPKPIASFHSSTAPMRLFRTITPREAEELAAHWMRSLGAVGVAVTQFTGDGGIDVTSIGYIAQVKHFATNVGVAPIRELSGVVRMDGRRGLFFATNGYAPGAIAFADRSGIALFRMHVEEEELAAVNTIAEAFLKHGLKA